MSDPTPMTAEEWAPVAEALSRHRPLSSVAVDGALLARIVATVDAERARREQAEAEGLANVRKMDDLRMAEIKQLKAERDELAAQLQAVLSEGLTADEFRRKYLDASPTEGNPE